MSTQRLSLITLPVDDLGAAIDFYQRAMGWVIKMRFGDDIAFVQMNGFVAALWSRASWEAERLDFEPPGYTSFAINFTRPPEVDEVAARWAEAGGEVAKAPGTVYWGGYSGYVRDPWGNLIELAVNDALFITEEGYTEVRGS
ncbi:MAG TPA: VOC family protein [Demequina sp.]|nr:VOC family protein [Demequina sp.]